MNRPEQLKKRAMLAAFVRCGGVVHSACLSARVGRTTHYQWLKDDPDYAKAVEEARAEAVEVLEREAIRRAMKGVRQPVYQGGRLVGHVQRYSDTLLIFLLKGAKPETYRDNVHMTGQTHHEHSLVLDTIKRLRADAEARRKLLAERIGGMPANGDGSN